MKKKEGIFLIIGYGNTLCSDDAVGQVVAQQVEKWNLSEVCCIYQHQLTPELVEVIKNFTTIIFVDACLNSNGLVNFISLPRLNINNQDSHGHYCNPEYLLYLTELIYQKLPKSYLITIPIHNLDLGEDLSDLAQQGVKESLIIIQKFINEK